MLRRCIYQLASRQSISRITRPITAQMPYFLYSRKEFSNSSKLNSTQPAAPADEASDSRDHFSKLAIGSVVVGAALMAALFTGTVGFKDEKSSLNTGDINASKTLDLEHSAQQAVIPNKENSCILKSDTEAAEKNEEPQSLDFENKAQAISEKVGTLEEEQVAVEGNDDSTLLSQATQSVHDVPTIGSKESSEESLNSFNMLASTDLNVEQNTKSETSLEQSKQLDNTAEVSKETGPAEADFVHGTSLEMPRDIQKDWTDTEKNPQKPLAESYFLQDEERISRKEEISDPVSTPKEVLAGVIEHEKDKKSSEDGKVVLDFIEVVHAAEKRQAELDAHVLAEERRILKEKYEKELKDARARELMYAEEAAILDKELNKEKAKAAATLKSLQEKAEKNLHEELQRKDEEADMQLKKVKELAKAELAAAIAKEKSSQIEKVAEANLNINSLCMAFYARSEEARQSHSVHKLALGTLALEDAISKGLPIRAEVDALHKSLEGIDKDSLLELALSSLPEEILSYGTYTQMQLNQKFESLKGNLRHFSLIPAGGGGILTHMIAYVASSLKMKEDQSGEGIESLISKVENFLVEGKFADAADALEVGVHGSEAQGVVVEWVRQARNRAVAEQALSLLQSYALSITFS